MPRWSVASTYKAVFAAMTIALATACASMPREVRLAQEAAARSEAETLATRYADAVRDSGEATAKYGSADRRRTDIERVRERLRVEMYGSGAKDVRVIVAHALGEELADAKADRARLLVRYRPEHPSVQTVDAGIEALNLAILSETGHRIAGG